MKRLSIILSLAALLVTSAFGQTAATKSNQTPADRAEHRVDQMAGYTTLTAEQSAQLKQIYLDAFTKMETMRKSGRTRDEMQDAQRKIMTDVNAKVKAVLTPAQIEQLRNARKEGDTPRERNRG